MVNKKPRNLPESETKPVLTVRVGRVLSLQMSSVSSRSCRHQRLWNNDFVSAWLALLYFHYFSSHSEYSLYHTSNRINISGVKTPGCILVEELLIIGGILRLWRQCCMNAKWYFQKGSYRINSVLSCICSRRHFGVKLCSVMGRFSEGILTFAMLWVDLSHHSRSNRWIFGAAKCKLLIAALHGSICDHSA